MSQIPQRLRAVVAVSAVGAGLLVIPATATADDSPSGGASAGGSDASAGGGAATSEPGGVVGAAGVAVVTAGSQVLDSLSKAAQSVLAPKALVPKPLPETVASGTGVPDAAVSAPAVSAPAVEAPAVADPVVEAAPSFARASAPAAAAAAPAAADPTPTPMDPISAFFARAMGNTNTNHCACGWIPVDDDDDNPPPDNPPPDNPPPDEYGWGLPVGVPGVGIPGTKRYRYVACAAGLTLPPVPFRTAEVPPLPPAGILPPGGGGGGGGGAAPLILLGGGLPVAGGGGPAFTAIPAVYKTGLTFETGLDDKLPAPNGLATLGALASILLAAGGGLLFWRRNAQRPTGAGRTVPVCRVPAGGLWE